MRVKRTIGDLVSLQRGYDLTDNQRVSGPIPVMGSNGRNGWHDTARAPGPGVTVGRSGASAGVVTYVSVPYWPHNTVLFVTDFKGNDPRFIAFLLSTLNLANFNSGSAQPSLNRNFLYPIETLVPPPEEQISIGNALAAYDDLIENNTRRIAILEEMARRIFEEWFVHFRAPGCEGLPMVDSPLGPIPKGWEVADLESLCSRITDGAHHSPPSILDGRDGRPMLSVKDMRTWGFDFRDCRSISQGDFDELVRNDCRPLKGDILVAKDGANLNKHTFLVRHDLDAVILSSIAILRPAATFECEFLVAALKSEDVSQRIKNSRSGAAIPRIILKDFRRLPLVLPPRDPRTKFDRLIEPIHRLCRTLSQSSANLRAQRDLLLPKLISGEIDLSRSDAALPEAAE
jgi:type I restriction enzyme, S subunit